MGFEPTSPMPRRISTRTQASIGLVRNRASTPDEVRDMQRDLQRFVFVPVFLETALARKADHIKWDLSLEPTAAAPASKVLARMKGKIDPG